MTDRAREQAERQLAPGEQLVWWGRPSGIAPVIGASGGRLGFMLAWTVFAVAWTGLAFLMSGFAREMGADSQDAMFRWFPLFGVPFILIGVVSLFLTFRGAFSAAGAVYGLTTQRVIVMEGNKVTSYGAADFQFMQRTGNDRRGTISFANTSIESGAKPTARLINIDQPARVESLIRSQFVMPK